MKRKNNLKKLREEIDVLDSLLITTLAKRMKVSVAIGKYKKKNNMKPLDKDRWEGVLISRIETGNQLGLPSRIIKNIFEIIHKYSLSLQKEDKL